MDVSYLTNRLSGKAEMTAWRGSSPYHKFPMSNNNTKKTKQSLKQLQNHLRITLGLWTNTADDLENTAGIQVDANMKEALFFAAAIYRTCCVDLQGVLDGKVILDKSDASFTPVAALIDQGGN